MNTTRIYGELGVKIQLRIFFSYDKLEAIIHSNTAAGSVFEGPVSHRKNMLIFSTKALSNDVAICEKNALNSWSVNSKYCFVKA